LPLRGEVLTVTRCGCISFGHRKINLGVVFAGQNVGVREVADHGWLVSFMQYDLGFLDDQQCRVECTPNVHGKRAADRRRRSAAGDHESASLGVLRRPAPAHELFARHLPPMVMNVAP